MRCELIRAQGSEVEPSELKAAVLSFLTPSYPDMKVEIRPWENEPGRHAIAFVDPKFALIYPAQRYHYLSHLIPEDFQQAYMSELVWLELAPGERPEDLRYPDEDLVAAITPDVMKCVLGAKVFEALDDVLCPQTPEARPASCWGDYRHVKPILLSRGFSEDELFDVMHVLMALGGFCDCELLFNVAEGSRYGARYWKARAEGREWNPHHMDG